MLPGEGASISTWVKSELFLLIKKKGGGIIPDGAPNEVDVLWLKGPNVIGEKWVVVYLDGLYLFCQFTSKILQVYLYIVSLPFLSFKE